MDILRFVSILFTGVESVLLFALYSTYNGGDVPTILYAQIIATVILLFAKLYRE